MLLERPLFFLQVFYKGGIWRIKSMKEKTIYLTFDDGPSKDTTLKILEILDKYNVKATFFCLGDNVEKYPELYKKILDGGHAVGNHTHHHLKGFVTPTKDYLDNIQKAAQVIDSKLFRPPYGRIWPSQLRAVKKLGYKVILWDLITCDYDRNRSPESIKKHIHWLSRRGSIVVFHDSMKASKNMLAVLPWAIEFWINKGYTFKVLS